MTEQQLDPEDLARLRAVLWSPPAGEPAEADWPGLLQQVFAAPIGRPTHGDLPADELLPAEWPVDDPGERPDQEQAWEDIPGEPSGGPEDWAAFDDAADHGGPHSDDGIDAGGADHHRADGGGDE